MDIAGNLYVADSFNHRVEKFTSAGVFLGRWGSEGSGDGEFNLPTDIAVDGGGSVYVADGGNYLQKFDANGTFLSRWGEHGAGDGQFNAPCGIAVDDSGNVYVADTYNHRVQKFDSNGTFLAKWGEYGSGNGQFDAPHGIAVDRVGNVYVADYYNHRVQKFAPVTPLPVIGGAGVPTDTDGDGLYDDVNGNDRPDFADVVLYFNQMAWIAANEPASLFDYNGNGRIDFADVVWLFNHL